jgi:hypothetical protein
LDSNEGGGSSKLTLNEVDISKVKELYQKSFIAHEESEAVVVTFRELFIEFGNFNPRALGI